jgi:hypothetical protein
MLKHRRLLHLSFVLASLSLAACLGYRTPMLDPNKGAPASLPPQAHSDAAAALAPDLAPDLGGDHALDRVPDLALDRFPDLAPDLALDRLPDLAPDLALDRAPDLGADLALDRVPDLALDLTADLAAKDARPDFASDPLMNDARADALTATSCPAENNYILLFGSDGQLYHFAADTLALTNLATVGCGYGSYLNSMTVSPIGPAYISDSLGYLCSVDMRTFRVTSTSFNPMNVTYSSYGMALLPDSSAGGQSLYIAVKEQSGPPDHLERIDLTTFAPTSIGYVTSVVPLATPVVPSAELTAGPNGELYGFAVGTTSSLLLNIDPKTASAVDVTKVPAGFSSGAFALVYWQDAFYLFLGSVGSGNSTVYRYHKGDAQVVTVGTVNASIIGAGVACASN